MQTVLVPYNAVRGKVADGDLLLFRHSRGIVGELIGIAGRSEYCHAAMAAWWNGRLMCLETVQGRGGRAVLLSNLVAREPGLIDVYRANANRRRFNRDAAVGAMIDITGRRYGWWSLLKASTVHLPVFRFLVVPDTDDAANGSLPFCSQAVARACRAGGADPVPNLADRLTEPGDLARSPFFRYRFTLTLDTEESHATPQEATYDSAACGEPSCACEVGGTTRNATASAGGVDLRV